MNEAQGISNIAERLCNDIIQYFTENKDEDNLSISNSFLRSRYGIIAPNIESLSIEIMDVINGDNRTSGQLSLRNRENPVIQLANNNIQRGILLHELTHFIHYINNPKHTKRYDKVGDVNLNKLYDIIRINKKTQRWFFEIYVYLFSDTEKHSRLSDIFTATNECTLKHPELDFNNVLSKVYANDGELGAVISLMNELVGVIKNESPHCLDPTDFSSLTALICGYAKISKIIPRAKVTSDNYYDVRDNLVNVLTKEIKEYTKKYNKAAYYGYTQAKQQLQNQNI
ncbi:MAG: hypothetical protein RSE41_00495 [Clostridia bacterium]